MYTRPTRNFRRRLRIGGFIFAVALAVLAVSVVLRSLLSNVEERLLVQGLDEGLLILGWVMMWRPIDILLFEHWESHLDHARLKRLASIPIEFVFRPDGGPARMTVSAGDRRVAAVERTLRADHAGAGD